MTFPIIDDPPEKGCAGPTHMGLLAHFQQLFFKQATQGQGFLPPASTWRPLPNLSQHPTYTEIYRNREPRTLSPAQAFAPYYADYPGGMTRAVQQATDYSKIYKDKWGPADVPDYKRLYQQFPVVSKRTPYMVDKKHPPSMPSYAAEPGEDGVVYLPKQRAILSNLGDKSRDSVTERARNGFPSFGRAEDTLLDRGSIAQHELGHAWTERPTSWFSPIDKIRRSRADAGYENFDKSEHTDSYLTRPWENRQALARLQREVTAITGKRVSSPEEASTLFRELRMDDHNAPLPEFVKRLSPEGQRLIHTVRRELRLMEENGTLRSGKERINRWLEHMARRMPLYVKNQTGGMGQALA